MALLVALVSLLPDMVVAAAGALCAMMSDAALVMVSGAVTMVMPITRGSLAWDSTVV